MQTEPLGGGRWRAKITSDPKIVDRKAFFSSLLVV